MYNVISCNLRSRASMPQKWPVSKYHAQKDSERLHVTNAKLHKLIVYIMCGSCDEGQIPLSSSSHNRL